MNYSTLADRLVVHWALQIPAAIASAHVPRSDDDSHSNFGWNRNERAFVSHPLGGRASGRRIALRPESLEVLLFEGDRVTSRLSLGQRRLEDGLQEANQWLEALGASSASLRDYEMPDHPVADGGPFPSPRGSDVAVLYHRAYAVFAGAERQIEADAGSTVQLSSARVWPHRFDLGGLLTSPGSERSIGYGLSPGDETFAHPYVYLNLYPPPDDPPRVSADVLHWNTRGFRGFVAPAEAFFVAQPEQALAASVVQCLPTLRDTK